MHKNVLLLLSLIVLCMCLVAVGCEDSKTMDGENDVYLSYATGEVKELRDDKLALISIAKARGGFKKNDELLVKFNEVITEYEDGDAATDYKKSDNLKIGDVITAGFFKHDLSQKDGYNYIEVDQIKIYV